MLAKMKVRDNHFCQFCLGEVDYVEHFFYDCRICQQLWDHVKQILNVICGENIMFNAKEVLGICKNDEYNTEEWKLINLCLLVGKVCVSKHKYGTHSHLKSLFDYELMIREKIIPLQFLWYFK